MEDKILLYDSNNVKIGETFMRRARQLVKQQRASWTDDSQAAVRFVPGAEHSDTETINGKDDDSGAAVTLPLTETIAETKTVTQPVSETPDGELIALAEKRISERDKFIRHSIAFLPGSFILLLLTLMLFGGSAVLFAFLCGSWVTAYIIHFNRFAVPLMKKHRANNKDKEERRARKLAAEVAKLKAELQTR